MKKLWIVTVLFLFSLAAVGDTFARGRGHGGRHGRGHYRGGVGIVVGAPLWAPWYYPSFPPPIFIERHAPPVYIERSPPVYIERPPPEERVRQAGYWYYCQSPSGYYPEVQECSGAWIKVPPRPYPSE